MNYINQPKIRIVAACVPVKRGNLAGTFRARVTCFENGRRLWSETYPTCFLHRHHAIEHAEMNADSFRRAVPS